MNPIVNYYKFKKQNNLSDDERNIGIQLNNNSQNNYDEFSEPQQNHHSQQQNLQLVDQYQMQNNAINIHSKKMDNSNISGKNVSDQSLLYSTPQKPKMYNHSNIDSNLDNTLPYIYQNNKITSKQQQLLQLQLTQKKQSSSLQRGNNQKTKKKGENLIPQIYGNNLFKNTTNVAALNLSFKQQHPSNQQMMKKSTKKTNIIENQREVNPFYSENEAEEEVNKTFHHPLHKKNMIADSVDPENLTDLLLQPQKLNPNIYGNNTSTNVHLEIIKKRASASLHNEPTKEMQSFTDSEVNDQTSLNRYSRKKSLVKRKSRDLNQLILVPRLSNRNSSKEICDKLNINEDLKQHQIMTFRNNWSQVQNELGNDQQYLTQYSNTMDQNKINGQNIINEKSKQQYANSNKNSYLRASHQSVDSVCTSITNAIPKPQIQINIKNIDSSIIQPQHENKQITEDTDDQTESPNKFSIIQQNQTSNLIQQNEFNQQGQNTSIISNQQYKTYQEHNQDDEGKDLSPVPTKPIYEFSINDIINRKVYNLNKLDQINQNSVQKSHEQLKRKQRSYSNRLQHLDQKESELVNIINRDIEYGVKLQSKNQLVGSPYQMNQLQAHQNLIQNRRLNDLKKHIQAKNIQYMNVNVDLKNYGYDKSNRKAKGKFQQNIKNNINSQNYQRQQQNNTDSSSRTNKKIINNLEYGVYLFNNQEFDDQEEENNTQTTTKQQIIENPQQNSNKYDQNFIENNNYIADSNVYEKYSNNYNNNSSLVSTNISSQNQSILSERQNGQISKEPFSRFKGSEKSHSQMPHQNAESYLSNDSFTPGNGQFEMKMQSNSLSPDSNCKNDNMMKFKLAKACIRFKVLGGGEIIEAEDYSLKDMDDNGQVINKFRINIKNVLEMEDYMEKICQNLSHSSIDYIYQAEKLIFLINEDPQYNINQVHRFFSDEKLCRVGKVLTVLELISIYLIMKIGKTKKAQLKQYFIKMRNLFTYTHQSFLLFWDQVYLLLTQNIEDKDCLERLRVRIEEKRHVKLGNKKSSYLQLKQNYDIICNQIKPIIKDIKEINPDIAKLFKVFEDQSIIATFNTIKNIFGWDKQVEDENRLKEFEIEQNKQNTSIERKVNHVVKRVRNAKPYLPAQEPNTNPYTLVLDLDETLIHFFETRSGGQYHKRPFCDKFLREMSKLYELVIFTAGTEDYANWVLNTLDKNKFISYRLSRLHTNFTNCVYIKDLSKIGRDLSKTIIIDNVPENFRLQKDNGIGIKSWYSDRADSALNDLIPVLTELVQSNPEDVRIALKKLRQKYPPNKVKGYFDLPY